MSPLEIECTIWHGHIIVMIRCNWYHTGAPAALMTSIISLFLLGSTAFTDTRTQTFETLSAGNRGGAVFNSIVQMWKLAWFAQAMQLRNGAAKMQKHYFLNKIPMLFLLWHYTAGHITMQGQVVKCLERQ